MNKQYTGQELNLIQQALISIHQSLSEEEVETEKVSNQWTVLKLLKVLYYSIQNSTFTQKKIISDLLPQFPGKTEYSLRELIKKVNNNISKHELLRLAEEMKEFPKNMNYIKALQQYEVRKYQRRFLQIGKGLIYPPLKQFQRIANNYIEKLNSIPIMSASDYSVQQILNAFPQHRKYFYQNISKLQQISHESQMFCLNRLINCSLDFDMAVQSLENSNMLWDKTEDIQLIDSMRKKQDMQINLFVQFKGVDNVQKRQEFLTRLERSVIKNNKQERQESM